MTLGHVLTGGRECLRGPHSTLPRLTFDILLLSPIIAYAPSKRTHCTSSPHRATRGLQSVSSSFGRFAAP